MRTESFHADDLARVLRRTQIATMPELKKALGTEVDVTVFRKLKQLAYRTSYSHRGSYYNLDEPARFDANGLWSFHSVWFSRQGTLLATAEAFVERSEGGYFVEELDHLLHVGTKEPPAAAVSAKAHRSGVRKRVVSVLFGRFGSASAPTAGSARSAGRTRPGQ